MTLQTFELHVLLAVLRLGRTAYSVPIVIDLEARTGRRVSQAAVFIALRRLETKGLVASSLEEAAAGGRVRRLVKPTRAGLRVLRDAKEQHARTWRGVDQLLDKA